MGSTYYRFQCKRKLKFVPSTTTPLTTRLGKMNLCLLLNLSKCLNLLCALLVSEHSLLRDLKNFCVCNKSYPRNMQNSVFQVVYTTWNLWSFLGG